MDNEIKPIAVAGSMPGTDGFTMACFSSADVPIGSNIYDQSAIDRLTEERDSLAAQLAECKEDAERLDWMDCLAHAADWAVDGCCPMKRVIRADDGAEWCADTWRSAIDAARKGVKK